MRVLVTGGAGYIGTHVCVVLLQAGYDVVVVDDFSNSHPRALARVQQITQSTLTLHAVDLRHTDDLDAVFAQAPIDAVIHLAGSKSAPESERVPLYYYDNNICGAVSLLQVMQRHGVRHFVFSSSAAIYGEPGQVPTPIDAPIMPLTPYGHTKAMIEQILLSVSHTDPAWRMAMLRYFNPVGAHVSGLIGEDPQGEPCNLVPYIAQVAAKIRPHLRVYGQDWPTLDGTGVRDYIHVMDLAEGHLAALHALNDHAVVIKVNLGTGTGYSVLQMVDSFARAAGCDIPVQFYPRRDGDIGVSYADPSSAQHLLKWSAQRDLNTMCQDQWRWQSQNPQGYRSGGCLTPGMIWRHRYQEVGDDYLFGTEPNRFLAQCAALFEPGQSALLVADGEGRNSVWLAEQGLQVTATDVVAAAIDKAKRLAVQRQVCVEHVLADMLAPDWPPVIFFNRFDWVVGIFIQFVGADAREQQLATLKQLTRPGGRVLLLGYTPKQLDYKTGGPSAIENLYTLDILRAAFADWRIEKLIEYDDVLDEGLGHQGQSALMGLVAQRPQ